MNSGNTNSEDKNERIPSVLDIELDNDIVGQDIPQFRSGGEDVSDLHAWFDPEEE